MSQQQILRIRQADDGKCVGEMKTRIRLKVDASPGPVLQC